MNPAMAGQPSSSRAPSTSALPTKALSTKALPREFFIPDLCTVQAVLFLSVVAELLAIVLELAASGLTGFSGESLAMKSLFLLWCFLLSAALLCRLRNPMIDWPLPAAAGVSYLLILLVTAATSALGQWLLSGINHSGSREIDPSLLATHVLICAVLAGIALRYFYLAQQLRLRQKTELQARIQALQSRIRPHFLFNSMNIIASLIAVDQAAAETAVEDLAALFRASLAEADAEVPLADELALCRRYARIEQLRLGDKLQMQWHLEGVPAWLKIPSLTLQPLLENAIYHGIQQLPEGGTVEVRGGYEDGLARIEVINPVPAPRRAVAEDRGNHLALDNIHHRLQAIYGPRAALRTELTPQQYRAVISYPVDESALAAEQSQG